MSPTIDPDLLHEMVGMVQKIASGEYSARLDTGREWGTLEALATGLNMLGEEIEDKVTRHDESSQESDRQRRAILNILEDIEASRGKLEEEVSERKAAEEALREKEETIRAFVETSQDWIWSIDLNGTHTYSNPVVETILGYRPNELVGKSSLDLMHEEDRTSIGSELPRWISEKRGWKNRLIRWQHKDGNWRYLESSGVPIIDDHGMVNGFRGVDRDVTERMAAEEALKEANLELDAFVRTASHDLRSPLVSLTGFLALLKDTEGENLSEPGQRFLSRIESNAQRMERLLDDLLKLSRAGRDMAPRQRIDLNSMMELIRSDFGPQVEEKGADLILPGELPQVHGETSAISQIFTNLISNALKYMGDEPEPRVELAWTTEDDHYHFTVSDNGIGIDPAYSEKIFESFETLQDERAGEVDSSGVGLNIVKRIIERHDGKVWVESDGRKGSMFHFTLPSLLPEPKAHEQEGESND